MKNRKQIEKRLKDLQNEYMTEDNEAIRAVIKIQQNELFWILQD